MTNFDKQRVKHCTRAISFCSNHYFLNIYCIKNGCSIHIHVHYNELFLEWKLDYWTITETYFRDFTSDNLLLEKSYYPKSFQKLWAQLLYACKLFSYIDFFWNANFMGHHWKRHTKTLYPDHFVKKILFWKYLENWAKELNFSNWICFNVTPTFLYLFWI